MFNLGCYKNPMKASSSASAVGRVGNDKVSDICGQLLPIFPLFLVVDGPSFPWLQQLSGRSQKRNEAIVLVTSSNLHVSKQITTFYIRARWIGPSEQKIPKSKTGHMYSHVKLNFRVGLFSCIFWFKPIFCCFFGILYVPYFSGENGQDKPENQQNWYMAKIAPKRDKFMK